MIIKNEHKSFNIKFHESAQDLYENAPCGYVSFLTDGTIFNINATLLSWLNFSKKEILYLKRFPDLFKIGGQIFFETHFFPLIRMQGFIQEINFDIVRKDKSTFPGLINVNEIQAKGKNPLTYRATIFDISDRKRYESELISAKEKAEEESQGKAEFLSMLSHEIRTPLHAILGIGNLLSKTHLNEDQKEYARILLLSSENLLGLVNNLLDLSKIEAQKVKLEKRAFNLIDLVKVLQQTFKVKASEKNIELLVSIDTRVPKELIGDPVKLSQILTNLIGNAIKFTKKGSVSVLIQHLETIKSKTLLSFKVCDTGIGIPKDKQKAIFQEFSQASYDISMEFGGTGLGLTISQKLLHLHNSEMKLKSAEGEGSEFRFEIWYKHNKNYTAPIKLEISKQSLSNFKSSKVLIVDDNPANLYITSQFLNDWKLHNETAENGYQAIKMIQKKHYNLILLDLHMPKMNGYETAKKIRSLKLSKQPLLIALSATDRGEINNKLQKAGFNDYIPKPFQPELLLDKLENYLHHPDQHDFQNNSELEIPNMVVDKVKKGLTISKKALKIKRKANSSFDVSKLVKMANSNALYLDKFLKSTLTAMEIYEQEFLDSVKAGSSQNLGELIHKSTMSIFYIKANHLANLMEEVKNIMEKGNSDTEILLHKSRECHIEFQYIIKGLKNLKSSDILEHLD